ncbi:MAG: hypothetical protein FWC95_06900 [Defluviitaleaceae bacterium]|nr:hypothetical protein [Defluviitaleaceae bacterium]
MAVINKKEDVLKKTNEIYPLLSAGNKSIAEDLHELALGWDMKIGISVRNNTANTKTHYDVQYSAKKPFLRMVFMFKICVAENEESPTFGVKLKLLNIDKYRTVVESYPDNIKGLITLGNECNTCNPSCTKQMVFTLDGVSYNMCTFGGGIFENLCADEWRLLKKLIIEDYNAHIAV